MKTKSAINIDYLKICYRQPEGLFNEIASTQDDLLLRSGYNLLRVEQDELRIVLKVLIPDSEGPWTLGTLTLNNGTSFQGRAFFAYDNRALYEVLSWLPGQRPSNHIVLMDFIAEDLGLQYNNCTRIDIALDTTVNILARLRKRIRNVEELDMYLCRHKVNDPDGKLDGYGEYYASTRKRLLRRPEIIIGQAKDEGTKLKMYDKSRELQEGRPDKAERYFCWLGKDWNSDKDHIYRVEVSIRNEDLKNMWQKLSKRLRPEELDLPFLTQIQSEEWLAWYFFEGLNSLIYFRRRETGEKVEAI
jgi:hypothetical protein